MCCTTLSLAWCKALPEPILSGVWFHDTFSTTYRFCSFTATHFGTGNKTGQVGYHYGQYSDEWVALRMDESDKESVWKMTSRTLTTMGYLVGAG